MCYDIIFKSVFINNENILAKMISSITGIDYNVFKDNIRLETNELPISRRNEKAKRCDFIVKVDKSTIVNLELNRQDLKTNVVKNLSYAFSLFATHASKGEEYDEKFKVMQININCYKHNLDALMQYYISAKGRNDINYINNFVIYSLNVYKCNEMYYNYINEKDIPDYVRWGSLIYCEDFTQIPKITKGILTFDERIMIMDKLDKLQNDEHIMSEVEALKQADWYEKSVYTEGKNIGREEGLEEGREKGKTETTINIIKAMLNNKLDIDLISKITNKTKEEILEIKENI